MIVPESCMSHTGSTIRTEPLVLVHGRLERHDRGGGAINLLATSLQPLHPAGTIATVHQLHPQQPESSAAAAGSEAEDFKAAAPAVTSFGRGRR